MKFMLQWMLAFTLTACIAPSEMMVGPGGNAVYCNAHGFGFVGAPLAHRAFSNCVEDHKAAGFLPIEEAGEVGIQLSQDLLVSVVTPKSPAANAGVAVGDKLVRINGQPVIDKAAAQTMLFGKVNDPVAFTLDRNAAEIVFSVTRGPRVHEDR
jgi:C-terminal processing protease CtpA/Prc